MQYLRYTFCNLCLLLAGMLATGQPFNETYRPRIHFSPPKNWMNDPNGMVFHHGVYHLFYQYHPYSNVWGPMHWGHATSHDLIHWKHQPIALYPDSLGTIFSGSAVVDRNNTAGFSKKGIAPIVAIFTQHKTEGEKAGRDDFQNQSLAYSLDDGKTWTMYEGNPVLKNPGVTDFRDPKVFWYEKQKKWIMTLATKDRITFYSSPNLRQWTRESEFGQNLGAHGGVWECPDLFPMDDGGKEIWVLIVNLNPGGPNGGSGTEYFVGDFDGTNFSPFTTTTKWLDYGPDDYAGVTWSHTGDRKIFLGWMSNWLYATVVPTQTWRNAMTIPRELNTVHLGKEIFVVSTPVKELTGIRSKPGVLKNIRADRDLDLGSRLGIAATPHLLDVTVGGSNNFSIVYSNEKGNRLIVGYSKENNQYFIDRTTSGTTDFHKEFGAKHTAPRLAENHDIRILLVVDVASVELFADNGLTVMSEIFFPGTPYDRLHLETPGKVTVNRVEYSRLKDIW